MAVITNAAEHYRRALALLPEESEEVKRTLDHARGVATARLSHSELELVHRAELAITALREGSALADCVWPLATGADLEQFVDAPMRLLADLACLRARLHLQESEDPSAYQLLADLMVFAHCVGRVGPLLSRLVHVGLVRMATDLAGAHLLRQPLSVLKIFSSRIDCLPDPGKLRDNMRYERRYAAEVVRPQFVGKSCDESFSLLRTWGCEESLANSIIQKGNSEPDGVIGQMDRAATKFDELGELTILPRTEFVQAITSFLNEHQQTCPAVLVIAGHLDMMHAQSMLWRIRADMLRTAIDIISSGDWPRSVRDSARNPFEHRLVRGGFELRLTPEMSSDVKVSFLDPITLFVGDGRTGAGRVFAALKRLLGLERQR